METVEKDGELGLDDEERSAEDLFFLESFEFSQLQILLEHAKIVSKPLFERICFKFFVENESICRFLSPK